MRQATLDNHISLVEPLFSHLWNKTTETCFTTPPCIALIWDSVYDNLLDMEKHNVDNNSQKLYVKTCILNAKANSKCFLQKAK